MNQSEKFGFNVIGHISSNIGLGVTARNVLQVIQENGYPFATYDEKIPVLEDKICRDFDQYAVSSVDAFPYGINIIVAPPQTILHFSEQYPSLWQHPHRLNVAFSMWELSLLSAPYIRVLESMDVLIAESQFVRHTFESHLSQVRILQARHPLYLPPDIQPDRPLFGLPQDAVLFLQSFDPNSDPQRKNPLAAVTAFRLAFPQNPQVRLIIKLNNPAPNGSMHPIYRTLKEHCSSDPRIRIMAGSLSYLEVLQLYASCDVVVSLHRSEGLGLVPMEAMALGKPVIATAYSGNMTYMDNTNSCLVGYRLIPTCNTTQVYCREFLGVPACWAEPDIFEAASWMRRLASRPALRADIGRKAAADLHRFQDEAASGSFLQELRALWEHREVVFSPPGRKKNLALPSSAPPQPRLVWPRSKDDLRTNLNNIVWKFASKVMPPAPTVQFAGLSSRLRTNLYLLSRHLLRALKKRLGPFLSLPEYVHDLGEVYEDHELTHVFEMQNLGNRTLKISGIEPDFACQVTFDALIPAGGRGRLFFTVKPRAASHEFFKKCLVFSNDPLHPQHIFGLRGLVKPFVEILPEPFLRFQGAPDETFTAQIRLVFHLASPVSLLRWRSDFAPHTVVAFTTVQVGKIYVVTLQHRIISPNPYQGLVELTTDCPPHPTIRLHLYGNMTAPPP